MKPTRKYSPKALVCILLILTVAVGATWKLRGNQSGEGEAISGEILTAPAVVGR
ncbi:MAG: hypothetical protein DVB23_001787, partial [Verrucomicrobia bacterium]